MTTEYDVLDTYTYRQLYAVWRSVWRSIGSGGHWGWDWPTLRITWPQKAALLLEVSKRLHGYPTPEIPGALKSRDPQT